MTRALFPLLSALLILPALAGCDLVKSGDEGNLEFELVSSDRVVPFAFGTPLAAGLSADVQVYVAGGDRLPAKVNLAQPTDQTIAVVTATQEGRFTLKAKQVGTTKVEVVSAAGNDSFDLAVNALARVTLLQPGRALVPESPPVRVAQGGTARFPFTLTDSNARQLIGYGPLPVEVAPAAAAAAATTTSAGLLSVDFMEPGDVTLTPLGADPLTVTVVPVSDITRLAFARADGSPTPSVASGGATTVIVEADNDAVEAILGLTGLVTVTTTTPTHCSVAQSAVLGDAVYQVTGLAAGTCEISATLGALSAATTVEVQ
ncbi:MAG: hypothetical protein CVU56_06065 [Deltaproteobacteria bacterium HGW-Deltaproteobacteria-14]|jgi:hypothetical protein|nr:MAG: hypothetical protein CVU56_06065 [Deltaproteobacteria bacterium HGW-Deltaproteobacteria-14]